MVGVDLTRPGAQEGVIALDQPIGELSQLPVIAYTALTGPLQVGARISVTVTGPSLGLGTGGYAMVASPSHPATAPGRPSAQPVPAARMMKARYLPMQVAVAAVEEPGSPHRQVMVGADSLAGTPVVIADLHSALPAIVAGIQGDRPDARVVYLMTDGGALPLAFSRTVAALGPRLTGSVTCGQAFGGTLDAVSVHSGLLAARHVLAADVVVVAQGPGNAGTSSRWGFSGVAAGEVVNAVSVLEGRPVAAIRMSAADPRPRHQGVSHHSLTALGRVALRQATLPVPAGLPEPLRTQVIAQLAPLRQLHQVREVDTTGLLQMLRQLDTALAAGGAPMSTMGRGLADDVWYFLAAAAAGRCAVRMLH